MNTTENNIRETNILIAEFMGLEFNLSFAPNFWYSNTPIDNHRVHEVLKYHSSWDWLMPVVEKIESFIFEDDEYYNFNILGGCYVIVISSHGNELITSDRGQSKLECTYNAVVDFIKWHNENSAKKE